MIIMILSSGYSQCLQSEQHKVEINRKLGETGLKEKLTTDATNSEKEIVSYHYYIRSFLILAESIP